MGRRVTILNGRGLGADRALSLNQRKGLFLGLVCLLTACAPALLGPQGHYVTDEGIYHFMVRGFAESANLSIWNGYEALPSPELVLRHTRAVDGELVPQYPYLTAVLGAPFYVLAGYDGLFILNALAFVAAVGFTYLSARTLFGATGPALDSCLILVFATFAWEYSQAAWPHALSMLFVTAAAYLAIVAVSRADASRRAAAYGFASGLVAGFGMGVRLDVAFVIPALCLPFLFLRPARPTLALSALLGLVPGLLVLTATNHAKFGVASPFTYGSGGGGTTSPAAYLPIALVGLAALAAAWLLSRSRSGGRPASVRIVFWAGLAAAAAAILAVPSLWDGASRLAKGPAELLLDFRLRSPDYAHGGMTRSPGGGLVYLGHLKKSLLQSCPYLVVLLLPLVALVRGADGSRYLGLLLLLLASFIGPYAYFGWDGGLSLNLRYLVPILPVAAVLTVHAWRQLAAGPEPLRRRPIHAAAGGAAALYLGGVLIGPAVTESPLAMAQKEILYLTVPLVIAAVAAGAVAGVAMRPASGLRTAAAVALSAGLAWAGTVALLHDFPTSYGVRKARATLSESLAQSIRPDSLVVSGDPHVFYGLPDRLRVRIALPWLDDFRDFPRLVRFHLERGHPVYVWVTPRFGARMREGNLFAPYRVTTLQVHEAGRLVELSAERSGEAPG